MMDSGHDHGGQHAQGGAPASQHAVHDLSKYIYVVIALCVLSTLSFITYFDPWPLDTPAVQRMFMMAVSCSKAMLVILFFMHLKYEANWKYVLTIPASIMAVFLVLALVPDIGSRVNGFLDYEGKYSSDRMKHVGQPRDVQLLMEASAHAAKEHAAGQGEH